MVVEVRHWAFAIAHRLMYSCIHAFMHSQLGKYIHEATVIHYCDWLHYMITSAPLHKREIGVLIAFLSDTNILHIYMH